MKAAACTCHAESHYRCVFCKPACALRAKAMSSVWCTLHGMDLGAGGSHVCGTEMNWWPPSVIRTQSAHHSFMPFLVHPGQSTLVQVSGEGRGDVITMVYLAVKKSMLPAFVQNSLELVLVGLASALRVRSRYQKHRGLPRREAASLPCR